MYILNYLNKTNAIFDVFLFVIYYSKYMFMLQKLLKIIAYDALWLLKIVQYYLKSEFRSNKLIYRISFLENFVDKLSF